MISTFARRLSLISILFLMTACAAGPPKAGTPIGNPEEPYPPPRPPQVGDILHLPTGTYVTETQMLDAVTDARIVYVGETHDNPASHRQQLAILQAMAARHPGKIALGMEMFIPEQQEALDRWSAGELDEKEFLKLSRWHEIWRMDFAYYRDLLHFARERGIPVIGLNAERAMVRAVSESEIEALSPEQREKLPEMDLSDPYHRGLTEAVFAGHPHGNDGEGFLRVQVLWDETMAENIARYLIDRPDMRMIVVAGGNHVRYGFGIPRRVYRRLPTTYTLVGSREIEIPEERKDRLMDVDPPLFPMTPYDFLAFTRYETPESERVRLGVMLGEQDGRVVVQGVLPGSAAELSGVKKGDIVLAIDGESIEESFDLVYQVQQKKAGSTAALLLLRDGTEMELEVHFPSEAQ